MNAAQDVFSLLGSIEHRTAKNGVRLSVLLKDGRDIGRSGGGDEK